MKRINFLKEPTESLGRLLSARRTSPRKYALFMVACCRQDIKEITNPDCRALIDLVERRADGEATTAAVTQMRRKVSRWASRQAFDVIGPSFHKRWLTVWGAYQTAKASGRPVWGFMNHKRYRPLLADVIGPSPMTSGSFSPEWRTDTVMSLARQMYESREFGAMPILADALQDAGCDDEAILDHCRETGTHVRGCWVVDLVLNKK